MSNSLIVIPARYGSTRFPGKPLVNIAGKSMLQHVWEIAQAALLQLQDAKAIVATDDERIIEHAQSAGIDCVMTSVDCETGTDRVAMAVDVLGGKPDIILNLQGDAPLTPASLIVDIIKQLRADPCIQLLTAVTQLSWNKLDELRTRKQTIPFTGTTAAVAKNGKAYWFSKQVIPAIRNEAKLRLQSPYSPVYLHHGIYGYRREMLQTFVNLKPTPYELLEGLEQLRMLEHGYPIHTIQADLGEQLFATGVDTIEDAKRLESML